MAGSAWGDAWGSAWANAWGNVSSGAPITNDGATTDNPINYEMCDRTNFRQLPQIDPLSKMRIEWTGYGVRADSLDMQNAQDHVASRGGDRQAGPQSSELNDVFLAASIAPEDL